MSLHFYYNLEFTSDETNTDMCVSLTLSDKWQLYLNVWHRGH